MKALNSEKLKMPFLSSIINIDSHSVRLEIFQVDRDGKKEILEHLDQSINMNADVFKQGAVSLKNISLLCDIIQGFTHKLREYDVKYYRAIISCVASEATNCDILISRIKTSTGIDIELLSPAEEIRLLFSLISERLGEKYDFKKINTFSFALGSSALLLMGSEQGKLKFCESIPLKMIRSFNKHGDCQIKVRKLLTLLESLNIQECFHAKSSQRILIGISGDIKDLLNIDKKWKNTDFIEFADSRLESIFKKISQLSVRRIIDKYHSTNSLCPKYGVFNYIIKAFLKTYKYKEVLVSPFSINDALFADMIRAEPEMFEDDIISVVECIGEKYHYDAKHIENVTVNCLKIFDKLQKKYALPKRSRILLHLAANLHDIGRFVSLQNHQKHSYYLIRNIRLPGISENEQLIVATVACCLKKRISYKHPRYAVLNKDEKTTINTLKSILLLGDALDDFRSAEYSEISLKLAKSNLTVKMPNCSEDLLEQVNINNNGDLLRETFGLKVKLCGVPDNYEV